MMNFIIFLIVLCAIFYFFKTIFRIVGWVLSLAWDWIKSLGYLLFLFIVIVILLRLFIY